MWWESGSEKKESDTGGGNDEPVVPVPVLVPSQSVPATNRQALPMPVVVPDVQDLKEQFQQQQNIITQIKETLKQNESQLSSKEKQVEAYANRLSQIKARSKTSQGKNADLTSNPSPAKVLTKKSSKENLKDVDSPDSAVKSKLSAKGKVSELKKRLEENKLRFEERTGKELSDTKKIESLVEHLQKQLEERDVTIQDLKKTIDTPPKAKVDTLPRRSKKENCASKSTQTSQNQANEGSTEVIGLQNKIYELETTVMDLNECLKEKESIIEARTQAVTLLTQDLSIKGKNTLDNLEETRMEMRTMQSNFVVIQDQLQKELLEKEERLTQYEEKNKRLESVNFDLSLKNAELQEKIVNFQTRNLNLESEIKLLRESVTGDDRLEELSKKIEILTKELDDSNKSMIKMKLEHKNKIKNLNKALEKVSSTSDEKGEIIKLERKVEELESINEKLENKIVELEEEKGNLLLSVLDVDDFKAAETKLNDQILELQTRIKEQSDDLDSHIKMIHNLESEKIDLMQANQDQNILIENLYAKIQTIETENGNLMEINSVSKKEIEELKSRIANMEIQHEGKIEDLKAEHCKEIELIETYYNVKGESVNKKELEEFRISNELNNIHVEEQIELLIREKQQLLEKLKNLSGVSSTDSLTFEKMEHSDLKDDKEATPTPDDFNRTSEDDASDNRVLHLQRLTSEQQIMITDLQNTLDEEKRKTSSYQHKITELEETIKSLEESNNTYKAQIENFEKVEVTGAPQKLNANTKNKIKKMQIELTENRRIVKEQTEKIKELNEKLEEKEELIKNYIEKIETYEKDDWGRENDWKTTKEDFDSVQELQKKCLSLENNLIELSEDCERLRKENIEIVHLLSEEKVQRKKLQEELDKKTDLKDAESQVEIVEIDEKVIESMEESVEVLAKSVEIKDNLQESVRVSLEERVENLRKLNEDLEEKVRVLEWNQTDLDECRGRIKNLEEGNKDLQEKLEWSNVVLTSKETEIFRLQSLLEDHGKMVENLERDLKERNEKLSEILKELSSKELQLEEISVNFDKLKECVDVANQTIMSNESQLKDLLETVGRMEEDVSKKENELKEIKGILAEKNLDMTNLRERLEEVNSDLTVSYQEHLENMRKCLRGKESEYEELLTEKAHLEELTRNLILDKEDLFNQKIEILRNVECLEKQVEEKEKIINELKNQMQAKETETASEEVKNKEVEDLKTRMKKLAANLKKKAQNEKDLLQQVKELQEYVVDKEKVVEKLKEEVADVNERWMLERREKEEEVLKIGGEKEELKAANEELKKKIQELMNSLEKDEYKFQQMETQLQKMYENSERRRLVEEQDKATIADLEKRFLELTQLFENLSVERESQLLQIDEERKRSEELRVKLEEVERRCEGALQEKGDAEGRVEGMAEQLEERNRIIESLEGEVERLKKKVEEDEGKVAVLENEVEEARRRLEEAEGMKEELEERNKLVAELGSEVAEVKRLLNELEGMKEERFRLENELGDLKRLLQEKEQQVGWLEGERRSLEEAKNSLLVQEDELRRRLESVMNELQQVMIDKEELFAKCNCLIDEKARLEERLKTTDEKKPVKRKSVTFRTDEVEYIKELKGQIHNYNAELKQARKEIEELKMELLRETMKNQVTEVILEAKEKVESIKSSPEVEVPSVASETSAAPETSAAQLQATTVGKNLEAVEVQEAKFDASTFFGTETNSSGFFEQIAKPEPDPFNIDYDSLTWDDSWGTDGHLEEQFLSSKLENLPKTEDFKKLELKLKEIEKEKNDLLDLIKKNQTEYSKKLKEQKNTIEALQAELNKLKNNSGFMGLDDAIIDELKAQILKLENRESELRKELQSSKVEKDNLLKRIDVLNAGNEKFLEMKEKQDSEAQLWELKNKELLKEMAELRNQLENPVVDDENVTAKENKELKNKIEALEWEICELKELLEEKQEQIDGSGDKVLEEKSILQKEIEELNNVREILEKKLKSEEGNVEELQGQVSALAAENDSLQEILGEMKKTKESENKIFDYFKSSAPSDFFAEVAPQPQPQNAPQTQNQESEVLKKEKEEWEKRESELVKNYENLHENYQISLREAEWLRNQLQEISETCQVERRRIAELEGELKERDERCCSLQRRVEELKNELMEKSTQNNELIKSLQGLQAARSEVNADQLQRRIVELEEKLERSTEQLNILGFEKGNLEENVLVLKTEIENLNRTLENEKLKTGEILHEREKLFEEINNLNNKLINSENKFQELIEADSRQKFVMDEYSEFRDQLESRVLELQGELEKSKLELSKTRRELEEISNSKDEAISNLKTQLVELENELVETSEKKEFELEQLKCEIKERTNYYENIMENKTLGESKDKEELERLRRSLQDLEEQLETLKSELRVKDNDIFEISQLSEEEQKQIINLRDLLEAKDAEIKDLKDTLRELQDEISHFRNFEKQVKELRQAQIKPNAPGEEGADPDLTDWSEHELAELNTRLQSDLDTALYMLHQRDVRCDELTFELMQLLEERDTLQLRLSTAIRINEELRSRPGGESALPVHDLQESINLPDQSNVRQMTKPEVPGEDLNQLQKKISELHSVGYIRDKTIRDESVQRHRDQMSLLGRVSDSDMSVSRDVQSPPTVLLNWIKGKTTPKVMHI